MKLIKAIILLLSAYGLYQLLKELSYQALIELTKNDEVETFIDFNVYDHQDLNEICKTTDK